MDHAGRGGAVVRADFADPVVGSADVRAAGSVRGDQDSALLSPAKRLPKDNPKRLPVEGSQKRSARPLRLLRHGFRSDHPNAVSGRFDCRFHECLQCGGLHRSGGIDNAQAGGVKRIALVLVLW